MLWNSRISSVAQARPVLGKRPRSLHVRRLARNRSALIGGAIVLFYIMVALWGPLLWPIDPYGQNLGQRFLPPVWSANGIWSHPFGTDGLGRDVLGRVLYGTRISLTIGFGAAGIGALIGVTLGTFAGYLGGHVDRLVTFILTCRLALPSLLLAMTLIYFIQPSVGSVVFVIGLLHWTYFLVVCRSSTRQIRELDYIKAAKVAGATTFETIRWDVLPNLMGTIGIVFTYEVAGSILAEASLSFLGVGIPAPLPSWGLMIADGKNLLLFSPWLVIIPGAALFGLVVGVNLLGNGLRKVFQPQMGE